MKKKILVILFVGLFIFAGCTSNKPVKKQKVTTKKVVEKQEKNNYAKYNGYLKLDGTKLKNEKNEDIVLSGISSHGLQWFNNLVTDENIKLLKNEWKANVFRLAMYTKEGGYLDNKNIKDDLIKDIDMIISNDMYVIVDWHILSDNNPNMNKEEAKNFFREISSKYKDKPNVIYEICNEPNGSTTYENDIKPYAEEVIKVIRENTKKSLIIVGTSTWSQDVDKVINNKINDDNVMYALHFYAGTHKEDLRNRVKNALDNKVPVFISEWGTSDASGDGGPYLDDSQKWIDFIRENKLSFVNWSLTDKNEKSAILKPGTNKITDDNLTDSGKFVKQAILGK